MANNDIRIKVSIDSKGMLKLEQQAQGAAAGVDNLTKKQDKYQRKQKGVAGSTSNGTKAFSKMQQGLEGGLVPAYATLAANVFAVTAAFGVLQRAAGVQQLEAGLMAVGRAGGANLKLVADRLREVTDLAISGQSAMEATAMATSAGFSEDQIASLGSVAKGTSLALGRDMTDAMTRLVRGTSKLEPELLDELGIFVKLGRATEDYADSIGKSVDSLTEFERRQAFVNAAIKEGQSKFGILNELVDSNPYDKLAASFSDLSKQGLNLINTFLIPVVSFLGESKVALASLFAVFGSGVISQILPTIKASAEASKASSKELAKAASKTSNVVSEEYTKAAKNVQKAWKTVPPSVAKLAPEFENGTYTAKQLKLAITRLTNSEKFRANAAINSNKEIANTRKKELAEVTALKNEMIALQAVEKKRFSASSAGVSKSRGSVSAGLTARGLTEMGNSTSLMQKFSIATRYSGLQMRNLTKASKAGATGLGFISVGFKAAAGSARMFGSALLSAIPVIGQVIMVGALVYEAFKWMFEKKPTLLDKELDKASERYAEFPNIVSQMAVAYSNAATRAEAFATAMRPGVGLLKQTKDQIDAILAAEKGAATSKVIEAQKKQILAQMKLNKLEAVRNAMPEDYESGNGISNEQLAVERQIKFANEAATVAAKALEEAQNFEYSQKAVDGVVQGVIELRSSTQALQSATVKGSSEWKEYENRLKSTDGILSMLVAGNTEGAIEALGKLRNIAVANQDAFDSSSETITKFTNAATASKKTTGAFAATIDLLNEALNKLASATAPETMAKYTEAFDRFGISYAAGLSDKKKGDLYTPEEEASLRAATKALTEHTNKIKAYNVVAKVQGLVNAQNKSIADTTAQAGQKGLALEQQKASLMLETQLATTNSNLVHEDQNSTLEEKLAAQLRVHIAISAELAHQEKIRKQSVADAGRLYGSDMGAVTDTTSMVSRDAASMTGFNSESIQTMNQAMAPMIANLAKLGPDGEMMASITQAAFTMSEVFTTAFEKMSEGSFGVVDGIQLAAGAIAALGQIQAAQGKAAVSNIDKQIAAEKKRDGQSAASLAKISAMEKKKESMERKNFERDKKMKMAMAISSTAVGIMRAYEQGGMLGFITGSLIAGIGAMQLSAIAGTSFDGGGSSPSAPTKISVGNRNNTTDLAKSTSPSGELAYARGSRGTGNMTNYTSAFTGYRASGGNTAFMVGEQGPEMFVPDRPGTIVPADETAAGQTSPINVNFSINTIDASGVEDLLMTQQGNIIGMIRTAANAHGQEFLETVDVRALTMEK